MAERIETHTIDTGAAAKNTVIQRNPCEVRWIAISVEDTPLTTFLKLYDGLDAQGKLKWQIEPRQARHCVFNPPIPCDEGLFIANSSTIACYTVAYRSKSLMPGEE